MRIDPIWESEYTVFARIDIRFLLKLHPTATDTIRRIVDE